MPSTFSRFELSQYLRMGINTSRAKLLVQVSFWAAAVGVGVAAALFARLINAIQSEYSVFFGHYPLFCSLITPVAFVAATGVCKLIEPNAGGSGVPQVLYAVELAGENFREPVESGLVSIRTSIVKVISTAIGFAGGASVGGEGPTVQISTSIFASIGQRIKRSFPHIDFQSYLVAGAGAGIAAAFNAPLGGVAFALEEVASREFGGLRQFVILAVIIAGLTSQGLIGNQLYLGNLRILSKASYLVWAIPIGVVGGAMGALFGKVVAARPFLKLDWPWWRQAAVCGVLVSVLNLLFRGKTGGSGYTDVRDFINGAGNILPFIFPLAKLITTALSTLSGMGGGILAPSLSIGAWMGVSVGKLAFFPNLQACALLGMVAYFTGAFQVPMTAIVIVMEMTNDHDLIIPMMIAAVVAFGVAKSIMPVSLYHRLIERVYRKESDHKPGPG